MLRPSWLEYGTMFQVPCMVGDIQTEAWISACCRGPGDARFEQMLLPMTGSSREQFMSHEKGSPAGVKRARIAPLR